MQLRLYGAWMLAAGVAFFFTGSNLLQYPNLLLSIYLFGGIAVILYALIVQRHNFTFVPRIEVTAQTFVLAFTMALALVMVKDALAQLLPLPHWPEVSFTAIETGSLFGIIGSVMIAAFMEEILFRGIIMEALLQRYSGGIALLQSSLLFMLAHPDPSQMPGALLLGILSGFFYLRLRDLCMSFLIHLVNNVAVAILLLNDGAVQFSHLDPKTYYGIVTGCVLALWAGYVLLVRCTRNIKTHASLSRENIRSKAVLFSE